MKNIQNKFIVFILVALAFPYLGTSQDDHKFELSYEVNLVDPPLSISKEQLEGAESLVDLNRHFKSSWIKEYESVEILTSYKGKKKKAIGYNDVLTQEQKDLMNQADVGAEISVKVRYLPDNTLKHNDIKEFKFSFLTYPEQEAKFVGGAQQLKKYLEDNVINKIPDDSFKIYQVAIVTFTVDEKGQVNNPKLSWTSKDEKIDELLLETVRKMPNWKPAEYANGLKVQQEFAFTVGDKISCAMNTLNFRRD